MQVADPGSPVATIHAGTGEPTSQPDHSHKGGRPGFSGGGGQRPPLCAQPVLTSRMGDAGARVPG